MGKGLMRKRPKWVSRWIFLARLEICISILGLIAETGMLDCKLADTPIVQNHHLAVHPDQVPTN